jgi:hypothetical protein
MFHVWTLVESMEGYDRTYRRGRHEVAFELMTPGMKYLRRDLFVDGRPGPIPLPPVYVEGLATLTDEFYESCLQSVAWHIVVNATRSRTHAPSMENAVRGE